MNELGDRPLRPQPPPSFETQIKALPPAVRHQKFQAIANKRFLISYTQ